jgi:hypothetical protein
MGFCAPTGAIDSRAPLARGALSYFTPYLPASSLRIDTDISVGEVHYNAYIFLKKSGRYVGRIGIEPRLNPC